MDVSIICATYNQEKYVRKAIDGFLMQKGDIEYEILIHDDASTDKTADILKMYKERYPDKITLILQKENQYSKGVNIYKTYVYPLVKGKYIAFCEGDDFWIYDHKLQKQYQLMEANQDISVCYHNTLIYQKKEDLLRLNINEHPSGYIEDRDVINVTKGWYPTASILCRADYLKSQPDFCISTGDEVLRTYMACRGNLYYMNRAWSVYREFSDGGWNTKYYHDIELARKHFKNLVEYFKEFNQYSNRRFEKYIKKRLFQGVDKFRHAHYLKKYSTEELRDCLNDLKNVMDHRMDGILDEYYAIYAIGCRDYYSTTIEKQLKANDQLYIYGAGNEALKALIELNKHNIVPKSFIVSDRRNTSATLLGIPIYGVDEFSFDDRKRIWPCLINGREDVLELLFSKGCRQVVI